MDFLEASAFGFFKHWLPHRSAPDLTAEFPYSNAVHRARCGLTVMLGSEAIESLMPWAYTHAETCGVAPMLSQWRLDVAAPNERCPATMTNLSDFDIVHLNKHTDSDLASTLRACWAQFDLDECGMVFDHDFGNGAAIRPDHITKLLMIPSFSHLKGVAYTVSTMGYGDVDLISIRDASLLKRPICVPLPINPHRQAEVFGQAKTRWRFQLGQAGGNASNRAFFDRVIRESKRSQSYGGR